MKQFFSESYTKVCIEASREQLEMRWQGIETYCEREEVDVYKLVRIYYTLNVDDTFLLDFISVFHEIDISFNRNNTRELSVLAGIILYRFMEIAGLKYSVIFSLICLSKYSIDVALPEVIEKAYKTFGELSASIREREITYKNISTKPLKDYAASLKDISTMGTEHITGLATTIETISTNTSSLVQNQSEMKKVIEIYREDSNILAWLFGNWSNELGVPLTKKNAPKEIALILAQELADLVSVLPGPYPVDSFLSKMLGLCKLDSKPHTLVEMVDALDKKVRTDVVAQYDCINDAAENTPILLSIKSAAEVGKPEVWQHMVSNRLGIDIGTIQNSNLEWALLMYFECMLIKEHEM